MLRFGILFAIFVGLMSRMGSPAMAAPPWCFTQNSFTPAENRICNNRLLGDLDDRLTEAYRNARKASPTRRQFIRSRQRAWLKRRNRCGARARCLENRYNEQIDWLDGFGGQPDNPVDDTFGDAQSRSYQRCFDFIMSERVNWGNGNRWQPENASWLCEGAVDNDTPPEPVRCFRRQLRDGVSWQEAIPLCRSNRGLVEGSPQQTQYNLENGLAPQRVDSGREGVDHSEDIFNEEDESKDDGIAQNGSGFCGWWAIYSCHRSRDQAIDDMNTAGYGGVVDTNDVPNFRNGFYCVAEGPTTQRRANILKNQARRDFSSPYIKKGC